MTCSFAWYVLSVLEFLTDRRLHYISSLPPSPSLLDSCSNLQCVCMCEYVDSVCEVLMAVGYLLTYDTPPACLGRWLLLSSCENQAYINTGKTEMHRTNCSIHLIDSICVCVRACVRAQGRFFGVCHAQPILWKSLSRSIRPSLPGKACK